MFQEQITQLNYFAVWNVIKYILTKWNFHPFKAYLIQLTLGERKDTRQTGHQLITGGDHHNHSHSNSPILSNHNPQLMCLLY